MIEILVLGSGLVRTFHPPPSYICTSILDMCICALVCLHICELFLFWFWQAQVCPKSFIVEIFYHLLTLSSHITIFRNFHWPFFQLLLQYHVWYHALHTSIYLFYLFLNVDDKFPPPVLVRSTSVYSVLSFLLILWLFEGLCFFWPVVLNLSRNWVSLFNKFTIITFVMRTNWERTGCFSISVTMVIYFLCNQ